MQTGSNVSTAHFSCISSSFGTSCDNKKQLWWSLLLGHWGWRWGLRIGGSTYSVNCEKDKLATCLKALGHGHKSSSLTYMCFPWDRSTNVSTARQHHPHHRWWTVNELQIWRLSMNKHKLVSSSKNLDQTGDAPNGTGWSRKCLCYNLFFFSFSSWWLWNATPIKCPMRLMTGSSGDQGPEQRWDPQKVSPSCVSQDRMDGLGAKGVITMTETLECWRLGYRTLSNRTQYKPPSPTVRCALWSAFMCVDSTLPSLCSSWQGTHQRRLMPHKHLRQLHCVARAGCTHHDEVDQRQGIQADVPEVHEAKQVAQDHTDGQDDHDRWVQVTAQ